MLICSCYQYVSKKPTKWVALAPKNLMYCRGKRKPHGCSESLLVLLIAYELIRTGKSRVTCAYHENRDKNITHFRKFRSKFAIEQ